MLLNKFRKSIFLIVLNTALSAETVVVLSRSGLHIRTKPEQLAQSQALAPFGTEIEVSQKTVRLAKIDGISAPWLKVKYDSAIGWIFAGYTVSVNEAAQNSQQACQRNIASTPYVFYNS